MGFYQGRKVLVAGGTGLIGTPLTQMLLDQGAEVRVASLDPPERANPNSEFLQLDLYSPENCQKACEGMDLVLNLMCFKGTIQNIKGNSVDFIRHTIIPNSNLIKAAHDKGAERYLFTSTLGVYGRAHTYNEEDVLDDENRLKNPPHFYAFAGYPKILSELETRAYLEQFKWEDISVVRPASTYGPNDNFDPRNAMVIPTLVKRVMEGENPLPVWGDGSEVRDFVHANDVARGMLVVLEKSPGPYHPVNLGGGKEYTVKDLVETIVKCAPNPPEVHWQTEKQTGDPRRFLNISRARALGWEPQIPLEQGIREVLGWYAENRDNLKLTDVLL
tara:strand:+ start:250 stop:1242 length:993 start_codon:yes stop_codon:yes gene_type:complete